MDLLLKEFSYRSTDRNEIRAYEWAAKDPKAAVLITHGAVEHALRYDDFAQALAASGFSVYAADLRGHGKTAGKIEDVAYFSDEDGGFDFVVDDLLGITRYIKEKDGLAVFLMGHSMGSLMARVFASKYGTEIKGLLLTGTGRVNPFLIAVVKRFAWLEKKVLGGRHRSPFLHSLVFGTLNRPFRSEGKSSFISTDKDVVSVYNADEFCGNTVTAEFVYELMKGTREAFIKEAFENCPNDLPVFVGAGEFDTMGGANLKAVKKDVADYRKAGVQDVEFRIYKGMRHEILNERSKKIVYADIIEWLGKKA